MWVNFAGCLNSKRLNPGLSMHGSKRDRISWQKVSDWRADSMRWAALYSWWAWAGGLVASSSWR